MKQRIKNISILLSIACLSYSCTRNINNFDKQEIGFDALPRIVQDTLIGLLNQNPDNKPGFIANDPDFVFLDHDISRYSTEKVKLFGPFVDGYKFTDNNKKYRIDYGLPYPYILYNSFLYHQVNYNIDAQTLRSEKFMKYKLE